MLFAGVSVYRLPDLLAQKNDPQPYIKIESAMAACHVSFNADGTLLCVSHGNGQALQIYSIANQVYTSLLSHTEHCHFDDI